MNDDECRNFFKTTLECSTDQNGSQDAIIMPFRCMNDRCTVRNAKKQVAEFIILGLN